MVLANYDAPNQEAEQLKVFDKLTPIFYQLDVAEDTTFIWGGDFNMIFDIDLDADGGSPILYLKSVSKVLPVMFETYVTFIGLEILIVSIIHGEGNHL